MFGNVHTAGEHVQRGGGHIQRYPVQPQAGWGMCRTVADMSLWLLNMCNTLPDMFSDAPNISRSDPDMSQLACSMYNMRFSSVFIKMRVEYGGGGSGNKESRYNT